MRSKIKKIITQIFLYFIYCRELKKLGYQKKDRRKTAKKMVWGY